MNPRRKLIGAACALAILAGAWLGLSASRPSATPTVASVAGEPPRRVAPPRFQSEPDQGKAERAEPVPAAGLAEAVRAVAVPDVAWPPLPREELARLFNTAICRCQDRACLDLVQDAYMNRPHVAGPFDEKAVADLDDASLKCALAVLESARP